MPSGVPSVTFNEFTEQVATAFAGVGAGVGLIGVGFGVTEWWLGEASAPLDWNAKTDATTSSAAATTLSAMIVMFLP